MTVLEKIHTVRDPRCLDGWVGQVTANTLKQAIRRRRLRAHTSWDDVSEVEAPSFQHDLQARDLAQRTIRVMGSLSSKDRALLTTYWLSPATARSIALENGCSTITVRRKLLRARARFEKLARRDPALARCFDETRADEPRAS